MIEKTVDDLKRDEGFSEKPYECPTGFWTIGYGQSVDSRNYEPMPEPVASLWLEMIVEDRWEHLLEVMPWIEEESEEVQRALLNMSYQLGVRGLLGFKKMLAALWDGDREKAAHEALDSLWAQQTPDRAKRVASLIRG